MSVVFDLRDRLVARIDESERELAQLRAALAAYDGSSGSATSRRTGAPATNRPRTSVSVSPAQLLGAIPTEGTTRARLAEQTGGSQQSVLAVLKQMEAAGQVARRGERRATTWHRADAPAKRTDDPRRPRARRSRAATATPATAAGPMKRRRPAKTGPGSDQRPRRKGREVSGSA